MKKKYLIILLMVASGAINAGVVEKIYNFDHPLIIPAGEYQMISFDNMMITAKTGEPALPYQNVQLLLPPGEQAVSIEFFGEEESSIPGNFNIFPQQASRPLSQESSGDFSRNELIYATDSFYPVQQTGQLTTSYMNGYAFAIAAFTPVKYNPVSGELLFYKKVTIKIKTEPSQKSNLALRNLKPGEKIQRKVLQFTQNPTTISLYPSRESREDDYNFLIITTSEFESSFQDLIDIYLERGIETEVATTEYIDENMTGQDVPEKMRNYIIQEYQDHNIEYVLLGGDVEKVPYRGFYCYVQSGSGYEDYNIPSDLYFSALDGNWNTNGNNRWGEPGEDDLLPEIGVGRFPCSNTTELNNMLHKTISYQNSPVLGEFNNTLFAGEWLYNQPETWGSDYLELLIGHHTDNGYETWGIPESYNFQKLYELNESWGAGDLMAAINDGKQYVHHVGHANEVYVAYMSNSDITNVNFSGANGIDHNYTIFQSHGCICGAFDYNDCIMEKMINIENFAVAVIGNSRYGWFNEGQTEGPSAHLEREITDALYHEKINHIGAAFTEAKIETAPWVTAPGQWEEGALRWNFYDINILGDPALSIWTTEPISIETQYENEIAIDAVSTIVTVTSEGYPMENFSCSILKDGILYGTATTDNTGIAEITFGTDFPTTGEAQLIISGNNCLPTTYDITISTSTGIEDINTNDFSLFPNPAANNFFVCYSIFKETSVKITLMNYTGREIKVLAPTRIQSRGNFQENFSTFGIKPGVYLIRIETENRQLTKKLVLIN